MLCSVGKGREKRRLRAAPFKTANAMKKKLIPLCALCAAAFAAQLKGEDAAKMQKLIDALEDLDDVSNVYTSAVFDEE